MSGRSAGTVVGAIIGPIFAAGSAARQARVFHPKGVIHAATVTSSHPVGERLAGGAIVRFSGAAWRRERAPDMLGMAIRFRKDRPPSVVPHEDDQDLVLATMRSVFAIPVAFFTTNPHDFLGNTYRGAALFAVDGLGRVRLQARPLAPSPEAADRTHRLDRAIANGNAVFAIEAASSDGVVELATLVVGPRLTLDEAELAFHPFREGQGIRPTGFVQDLRRAVYPASQAARRSAGEGEKPGA